MPSSVESRSSATQTLYSVNGSLEASRNAVHAVGEVSRHGFTDDDEEYLALLEQVWLMYYNDKRHESSGHPRIDKEPLPDWRMRERMKTFSAALVTCLNIGTDPPDIVKTQPCAKLECWVDPYSLPVTKALEQIGKNLQQQYETLSMRTRYKIYLDPSVEETKKFCAAQRRNAKDERVLFHYNGHGVPKPTASGEIWVFNKTYTQYIPVSLYDLQAWLGSPCLYVFDCSAAGNIITNFHRFAEQRDAENLRQKQEDPQFSPGPSQKECILLAACGSNEILPMNPDLPADLFTCCLTSPIEIAVRWFVLQNPLPSNLTIDMVSRIPGRLQDRRTALGELNWIFTAITDTIAWNVLPGPLFKRLFRQDLMVAALFRNFLLAERIMRHHQCHPQSHPVLPSTYNHPMWDSWDLAIDTCLAQLPAMLEQGDEHDYQPCSFFTEQLQAFEVWLGTGSASKKAPDQLPIVLQVLLSQAHRLRALILLSRFLDLGPWAVNLALSIGIFPYVLKLLQSPASELKPVLIFIWARILAVDGSCQQDLLKANEFNYFVQTLLNADELLATAQKLEHKAMASFILAMFTKDFKAGQVALLSAHGLMAHVLQNVQFDPTSTSDPQGDPQLRQWSLLLISCSWKDNGEAKWSGVREHAPEILVKALGDFIPEVRAAALVAMTTFLGLEVSDQVIELESYLALSSLSLSTDGSPLVRKELTIFFSHFILRYEGKFIVAAYELLQEEAAAAGGRAAPKKGLSSDSIYAAVWKTLLMFTADPYPEVEQNALAVVDRLCMTLCRGKLGPAVRKTFLQDFPPEAETLPQSYRSAPGASSAEDEASIARTGTNGYPSRTESHVELRKVSSLRSTLQRSVSIATSIKNLALGFPDPPTPTPEYEARPNQPPPVEASTTATVQQAPLARGMPAGFEKFEEMPSMPLKSTVLQWATEFFTEPQMKPDEADEPGSIDYNERLWRRTRNEDMIAQTQPLKSVAENNPWTNQSLGMLESPVGQPTTRLVLHQFEPHLVAADDRDGVTVWDWQQARVLHSFSNANPQDSRITELKFLNEDDRALLLTGSSEGVVRLYRNYETSNFELVTSWRALSDMLPSNRSSGLVCEWQQGRGHLLVGGDVRTIRVFDAQREISMHEIPARSGSCVTSLTSDQVAGQVFAAGFGDGAIRIYDKRLKPAEAMVKLWKPGPTSLGAWITNVHMQRGGARELVSSSVTGEVRLWDLRLDAHVREIQAHAGGGLRSLAVHEHAPVFATGATNHILKVWNFQARPLSTSRHYAGTGAASIFTHHARNPQAQSSSISALAFHPHDMVLASSGGGDTRIHLDKPQAM
ncbi:Target of rapamycin complex 1 subunit kog1 [Savitreella phatthalungensis]